MIFIFYRQGLPAEKLTIKDSIKKPNPSFSGFFILYFFI